MAVRSGHSRLPVIGENVDDVLGVVYLKDLVKQTYHLPDGGRNVNVCDVMRPAVFVPDSKPLDSLLAEMQRDRNHMAILVDEYGGIAGLVTIEDVIEEIVGEIADEYDEDETPPIEDLGDGMFRVSARLPIEDLGELFDLELELDEVETVGGLIGYVLGRSTTSRFRSGVRRFDPARAKGTNTGRGRVRISTVFVQRIPPSEDEETEDTDDLSESSARSSYEQERIPVRLRVFRGVRPNTGKSTLTNALVGSKIAITSSRPQTTRHTIRGIVHREHAQLILVDTPGLHKPRTLLGQRLNDLVRDTYSEVDVICLCIPADEAIGPGDRWIVQQVRQMAPKTKLVGIVTKIDKVSRDAVGKQLLALSTLLGPESEVVPVSAKSGEQVEILVDVLAGLMDEGPAFYPDGELTDEPEEVLMAELIREAALEGLGEELPHSLAVVIEEVIPREGRTEKQGEMLDVHALLYVEAAQSEGHRHR